MTDLHFDWYKNLNLKKMYIRIGVKYAISFLFGQKKKKKKGKKEKEKKKLKMHTKLLRKNHGKQFAGGCKGAAPLA